MRYHVKYWKNSNTGEILTEQFWTVGTRTIKMPHWFYRVNQWGYGKPHEGNMDMSGYVEISEKKYYRLLNKKLKQ